MAAVVESQGVRRSGLPLEALGGKFPHLLNFQRLPHPLACVPIARLQNQPLRPTTSRAVISLVLCLLPPSSAVM